MTHTRLRNYESVCYRWSSRLKCMYVECIQSLSFIICIALSIVYHLFNHYANYHIISGYPQAVYPEALRVFRLHCHLQWLCHNTSI